jgi:hypothetical protein
MKIDLPGPLKSVVISAAVRSVTKVEKRMSRLITSTIVCANELVGRSSVVSKIFLQLARSSMMEMAFFLVHQSSINREKRDEHNRGTVSTM